MTGIFYSGAEKKMRRLPAGIEIIDKLFIS
jgi:hypothetical protein